jgi:hypothetical protein
VDHDLRVIIVVFAVIGFGAGIWSSPARMRWTYILVLGAILAGNLPPLAKQYVSVSPPVERISSVTSVVLALAGTVLATVDLVRVGQRRRIRAGS